jgi:hypothetical protein
MTTAGCIDPVPLIDFATVVSREAHRREGISFPEDTLADLRRIAKETGLESKLPF